MTELTVNNADEDKDGVQTSHWYLIHTKPQQELRALQNLERQGYVCFYPKLTTEKLKRGALALVEAPLFPRYLFLQSDPRQSMAPIYSTQGVSRLVRFGVEAARVDPTLIKLLKNGQTSLEESPKRLFAAGDNLLLTEGPFAGFSAIYQMKDSDQRVIVLIEMLGRVSRLKVAPHILRKAA